MDIRDCRRECLGWGEVVYLYGEVFGKLLDENLSKSVVPAGLDPLSRGLVPAIGSRRQKMDVCGDFGPFGLLAYSRRMKPRISSGFGRLWSGNEAAEPSFQACMAMEV